MIVHGFRFQMSIIWARRGRICGPSISPSEPSAHVALSERCAAVLRHGPAAHEQRDRVGRVSLAHARRGVVGRDGDHGVRAEPRQHLTEERSVDRSR